MSRVVHVLKEGLTLCGLDPQFKWPDDHRWVAFDDRYLYDADCWICVCRRLGKEIPVEPPCPEHEKVDKSGNLPQKLCEFVHEFLAHRGYSLAVTHQHDDEQCYVFDGTRYRTPQCGMREGSLWHAGLGEAGLAKLAAAFIDVDADAYHREKDALLAYVRACNDLRDWVKEFGKANLLLKAGTNET